MCKNRYKTTPEQGYRALGYAVVVQAAEDYLDIRRKIYLAENFEDYSNPEILSNLRRKKHELIRFFMSDWYTLLGFDDVEGKVLLQNLNKEFEERKANNFKT